MTTSINNNQIKNLSSISSDYELVSHPQRNSQEGASITSEEYSSVAQGGVSSAASQGNKPVTHEQMQEMFRAFTDQISTRDDRIKGLEEKVDEIGKKLLQSESKNAELKAENATLKTNSNALEVNNDAIKTNNDTLEANKNKIEKTVTVLTESNGKKTEETRTLPMATGTAAAMGIGFVAGVAASGYVGYKAYKFCKG